VNDFDISAEGLTTAQVRERIADGRSNRVIERTSRSLTEIVRANVLTRFNGLLGVIGLAVLSTGRPGDALFLGVIFVNSVVGIVQEMRAKRTLDRLAVLNAPLVSVRRDGADVDVATDDVVLDDLVVLEAGDQVVVDASVVSSVELEVDESLLTGEADPVAKSPGDRLLSGSFIIAGRGTAIATGVGSDAYAHRLATEARRFSLARSELMDGTNRLLRWISWILLVLGPVLFISELRIAEDWRDAMTGAAAGLVGMVPEGLVLLTTLAFMVAVLTLARRHVLVQELPAVEGLARVDVVCLDKTGTLTEGGIELSSIETVDGFEEHFVFAVLGAIAADRSPNATARAIAAGVPPPHGWERQGEVPFSSARKWAAAAFEKHGTFVLGAPEIVLASSAVTDATRVRADELAAAGRRVMVLARVNALPCDETLPDVVVAMALVVLDERVRGDAAETLRYFSEQGVSLKVISGDNPLTVGAVAGLAGVDTSSGVVDARELGEDVDRIRYAIDTHDVFGRVTPRQKQLFVAALQEQGHVVAMTGDGVNDALALKDADVGVAMGSGAAATRAVAQIVLLDGKFARLPDVLGEGRRVIANIERVASLFVVKNVMSALLSLTSVVGGFAYPFLPRHLTIFSSLTIGIPAFVLALAPNPRRYVPGFLRRVLRFSVPVGVVLAVMVSISYALARRSDVSVIEARTAAMVTAMMLGLTVLAMVSQPWRAWKIGLVGGMGLIFVMMSLLPAIRELLELAFVRAAVVPAVLCGVAGAVAVVIVGRTVDRSATRHL
jgi:cation-transporting P-type ATPase E